MRGKITITLTLCEAQVLRGVADNGADNGLYFVNEDGTPARGGKVALKAYERATDKIAAALRDAWGLPK